MPTLPRLSPLMLAGAVGASLLLGCDNTAARDKKALAEATWKAVIEAKAQAKAAQIMRQKDRERERLEQPLKKEFDEACYAAETESRKKLASIEEKFLENKRNLESNSRAEQEAVRNQVQDMTKALSHADWMSQQSMYRSGISEEQRSMLRDERTAIRRKYEADMRAKQDEGEVLLASLRQRLTMLGEEKEAAIHAVQSHTQDALADAKNTYNSKLQTLENDLNTQ